MTLYIAAANAEDRSDFLFFANLTGTQFTSVPASVDLKDQDWEPAATFLYTYEAERLRLFAELHASEGGTGEIARLQAGWRFTPQTTLWVGRFHNPQGYWNTQYHHGTYLQTSISRPGIERFDDEGGILPSHFIGLQLDGTQDEDGLRYEFALGVSGILNDEGLESPAFLASQRTRKSTTSLRLTYSPTELGPLTLGAFFGRNHLPVEDLVTQEVIQTVYGAYGTLDFETTRLIGSVTALNNELKSSSNAVTGRFTSAYVQAEYNMTSAWTVYGRVEASSSSSNDPYLALFPYFIKNQHMAGLRWDLHSKHALKLEYSRPEIMAGSYEVLAVEWSMIFP